MNLSRRNFLKTLGIVVAASALPLPPLGRNYSDDSGIPIGSIQPFIGENIPEGWMLCDGRTLSVPEYPELFLSIEQYTGGSDWVVGSREFKLPDLRANVLKTKPQSNTVTAPRYATINYYTRVS